MRCALALQASRLLELRGVARYGVEELVMLLPGIVTRLA